MPGLSAREAAPAVLRRRENTVDIHGIPFSPHADQLHYLQQLAQLPRAKANMPVVRKLTEPSLSGEQDKDIVWLRNNKFLPNRTQPDRQEHIQSGNIRPKAVLGHH